MEACPNPSDKRPLAHRLALLAQSLVNGESDLVAQGPTQSIWAPDGNDLVLRLRTHGRLLISDGAPPRGFEMKKTATQTFTAASATLEPDGVSLRLPNCAPDSLTDSTDIRYAFQAWNDVNLTDASGLPTHPFHIHLSTS